MKRDLRHIATNYSTDIDYKEFINICKCASELDSFLNIDSTLLANDSIRFRKESFRFIIKMTWS